MGRLASEKLGFWHSHTANPHKCLCLGQVGPILKPGSWLRPFWFQPDFHRPTVGGRVGAPGQPATAYRSSVDTSASACLRPSSQLPGAGQPTQPPRRDFRAPRLAAKGVGPDAAQGSPGVCRGTTAQDVPSAGASLFLGLSYRLGAGRGAEGPHSWRLHTAQPGCPRAGGKGREATGRLTSQTPSHAFSGTARPWDSVCGSTTHSSAPSSPTPFHLSVHPATQPASHPPSVHPSIHLPTCPLFSHITSYLPLTCPGSRALGPSADTPPLAFPCPAQPEVLPAGIKTGGHRCVHCEGQSRSPLPTGCAPHLEADTMSSSLFSSLWPHPLWPGHTGPFLFLENAEPIHVGPLLWSSPQNVLGHSHPHLGRPGSFPQLLKCCLP